MFIKEIHDQSRFFQERPSSVWNMVVSKFEGHYVAIRFIKKDNMW